MPRHIKILKYKGLFQPHLNYCNLVWGTKTMSNNNKLHLPEKKKAVCIILNVPFDTHTPKIFRVKSKPVSNLYEDALLTRYKSALRFSEPFLEQISILTHIFRVHDVREGERWKMSLNRTNYKFQILRHNFPLDLNQLQKNSSADIEILDFGTNRHLFLH